MNKQLLEKFSYSDLEENYKRLKIAVDELKYCFDSYREENRELYSTNDMLISTIEAIITSRRETRKVKTPQPSPTHSVTSTEFSDYSFSEINSQCDSLSDLNTDTAKITLMSPRKSGRIIRKSHRIILKKPAERSETQIKRPKNKRSITLSNIPEIS
ncbi:unnamed protein product [Blepharisma stoltei]|uniref:Shugoshin C-terminal domain-containing protein n=1 Tax=Blepharisma stoltei TaxID=1481888 RepID=A0AAU9JYF9_9CILI|nr:unnamed protein product [Blepharisma stoltei]